MLKLTNAGMNVLVVGQPIVAVGDWGVRLGGGESGGSVFALAGTNSAPKQPIEAITQGAVTRADWTLICGEKYLTPGSVYYVGALGKLTTQSGDIEAGIADTQTRLSVNVKKAGGTTVVQNVTQQVANSSVKGVYKSVADPNGEVFASGPAICIGQDSSVWVKLDAEKSATGWTCIIAAGPV